MQISPHMQYALLLTLIGIFLVLAKDSFFQLFGALTLGGAIVVGGLDLLQRKQPPNP